MTHQIQLGSSGLQMAGYSWETVASPKRRILVEIPMSWEEFTFPSAIIFPLRDCSWYPSGFHGAWRSNCRTLHDLNSSSWARCCVFLLAINLVVTAVQWWNVRMVWMEWAPSTTEWPVRAARSPDFFLSFRFLLWTHAERPVTPKMKMKRCSSVMCQHEPEVGLLWNCSQKWRN